MQKKLGTVYHLLVSTTRQQKTHFLLVCKMLVLKLDSPLVRLFVICPHISVWACEQSSTNISCPSFPQWGHCFGFQFASVWSVQSSYEDGQIIAKMVVFFLLCFLFSCLFFLEAFQLIIFLGLKRIDIISLIDTVYQTEKEGGLGILVLCRWCPPHWAGSQRSWPVNSWFLSKQDCWIV